MRGTVLVIAGILLAASSVWAQTGVQRLRAQMPPELWDPALVDWVNDVAVIAMPRIPRDHRQELLNDFDLDMLDWYCGMDMNTAKFFRHRGIRCSAPEEYEYQEALQFSREDARRFFTGNGIATKLDGSVAHFSPQQYGGAQFMTHLAPKWHEVVKQGMARVAPFGDSVTQDNIGVILNKGGGNFSDWANRQFQRWLRGRFTPDELKTLGVERVADVQMREYLSAALKDKTKEELLEDRLVREYIRFMYFSHMQAWVDCATAAKREALEAGARVPAVYGNQWGAWGTLPYATVQSQWTDVVWIEGGCTQPPFGHTTTATGALFYKLGRAAGDFRKPVWTIEYPEHDYPDKRWATGVALADAFSNGGFLVGLWSLGDTASPRYEVNKDYYGLAAEYRPLFTRREQLADVALVWSFPSNYWRGFSSLRVGVKNQEYMSYFARMMEDLHVAYEPIILGHPDLFHDSVQLQHLARRRVIIVPAADCMSDTHAALLKRLVRAGATVILSGDTGTRDENYEPREAPVLADVLGETTDGRVVYGKGSFVVLPDSFIEAWRGADRAAAREQLEKIVQEALGDRITVRTDAPALLWTNPWLCAEGQVLAVHLTNYDVDLKADVAHAARDFYVGVKLPRGLAADHATLLRPAEEPLELEVTVHDGRARVQVPEIEQFGVLTIYRGDALKAACELAQGRRALDRISVALEGREPVPPQIAGLSAHATKLLRAGRYSDALWGAHKLRTEAETKLAAVIAENVAREVQERQARLQSDAPHKFDFGQAGAAEGWSEVAADTAWSEERGFGWLSTSPVRSGGGDQPDLLHGDNLRGVEPATFAVALADGDYEVTLIEGDPGAYYRCAVTEVDANGVPKLLGAKHWGGVFSTRSFLTQATGGRLELTFHGDAVGPCYSNGTAWQVAGLTVRPLQGAPSPQAQANANLTAGSLHDWAVVGAFDDQGCEGLSTVYPPERDDRLTASYQEGGTELTWRHYKAPKGGLAPIPLAELFDDTEGVAAFGLTQVHVPSARRATLHVGTTGRAKVWLNGEVVVVDEVTAGLSADEFVVRVALEAGWNKLMLKVCNNWHQAFAYSVCITDLEGRPFKDLRCAAADEPIKLAEAVRVAHPTVSSGATELELGGEITATVTFTNKASQPLSGSLSLTGPQGVIGVEPAEVSFEGLSPAATTSADFAIRGMKPSAEAKVALAALARVGKRAKTRTWDVNYRQPRLDVLPVSTAEPRELQIASMDDVSGWTYHPDRPVEGAIQPETKMVKEGRAALRVRITTNGDGKEDYPQAEPAKALEPNNWTGYDRLSLWAYVTDEDPSIKKRPICIVIYDQQGTQHALRREVPVGQWQRLEWDLSKTPRWNIPGISIYLYEMVQDRRTTYTWILDDLRLTRTEALEPPSPLSIPVIAALTNPLSRPVSGELTLAVPDGWQMEPGARAVEAPARKSRAVRCYLTPPEGAAGKQYPVSASFTTETYTLIGEASVHVRPRVVAPRTQTPPTLDGALDDVAWQNAAKLSGFVLNMDGRPVPTPTDVYLTYDDAHLYVAYRCTEPDMEHLVAKVTERDGKVWMDDCLEFYLEADGIPGGHDHYIVNTLGTIRVERGGQPGWGWRAEAAARVSKNEWTAEVAVPFADYERPPGPGDRWLANFNRTRQAKPGSPAEYQCWSCTYGSFEQPDRFGELVFGD